MMDEVAISAMRKALAVIEGEINRFSALRARDDIMRQSRDELINLLPPKEFPPESTKDCPTDTGSVT